MASNNPFDDLQDLSEPWQDASSHQPSHRRPITDTHQQQQHFSSSPYGADLIDLQQGDSFYDHNPVSSLPPSTYPAATPTQPRNPPLSSAAPALLQTGHQLKRTDTFATDGKSRPMESWWFSNIRFLLLLLLLLKLLRSMMIQPLLKMTMTCNSSVTKLLLLEASPLRLKISLAFFLLLTAAADPANLSYLPSRSRSKVCWTRLPLRLAQWDLEANGSSTSTIHHWTINNASWTTRSSLQSIPPSPLCQSSCTKNSQSTPMSSSYSSLVSR